MQDTIVKVKSVVSDEKKHIRFADWSAHDVRNSTGIKCKISFLFAINIIILFFYCQLDRSVEQTFILDIKTMRVSNKFVGKRFHPQEE